MVVKKYGNIIAKIFKDITVIFNKEITLSGFTEWKSILQTIEQDGIITTNRDTETEYNFYVPLHTQNEKPPSELSVDITDYVENLELVADLKKAGKNYYEGDIVRHENAHITFRLIKKRKTRMFVVFTIGNIIITELLELISGE